MTLADLSKVIGTHCPGDTPLVVTVDNIPVDIVDVHIITSDTQILRIKIKTKIKGVDIG